MKATRNQVSIRFAGDLHNRVYPDVWEYGTSGEFFYVEIIGRDMAYRDYFPVRNIESFKTTTHEV